MDEKLHPIVLCDVVIYQCSNLNAVLTIFFFFFFSFLLSNKHGYKQYTEQLCCIKQYLIVAYDISTAHTITVKSLI